MIRFFWQTSIFYFVDHKSRKITTHRKTGLDVFGWKGPTDDAQPWLSRRNDSNPKEPLENFIYHFAETEAATQWLRRFHWIFLNDVVPSFFKWASNHWVAEKLFPDSSGFRTTELCCPVQVFLQIGHRFTLTLVLRCLEAFETNLWQMLNSVSEPCCSMWLSSCPLEKLEWLPISYLKERMGFSSWKSWGDLRVFNAAPNHSLDELIQITWNYWEICNASGFWWLHVIRAAIITPSVEGQ